LQQAVPGSGAAQLKVEEVKKQLKSSKKIIHKTQGGEP
jgi:hypothetical protein